MTLKLTVNGRIVELEREMTITEFLRMKGLPDALVAVEHNERWLRREEWHAVTLKESDHLEVIRMIAGG